VRFLEDVCHLTLRALLFLILLKRNEEERCSHSYCVDELMWS
jgi:hypothetical protein